ncbi:MAG: D-alanine--D-alanine ligase [Mesorhizobium sp.]|nr:MAG: D-alanine--D-alanine ligase [Mesorhizobium sp.]TIW04777.1 MAG: D-alanine--D-alanine ligase [Mesorhizobium sp.]
MTSALVTPKGNEMPLPVSFIFGGISTEYDGSVASLISVMSTYLELPVDKRPFRLGNLYHVCRTDGRVRTIPYNSAFTIDKLHKDIYDGSGVSAQTLLAAFDTMASRSEYVVNLLHGQFGEDGGAQTLAAISGVRGTFGDPQVASLTMNKYAMSSFVSSLLPADMVKVPQTMLVTPRNIAEGIEFAKSIQGPIVVKPNSLGSSLFSELFYDPDKSGSEIETLLRTIFCYDSSALLQEFISGDEYTCGCIISSSGLLSLPVIKIEADSQFCGRDQKYSNHVARKSVVSRNDTVSRELQGISETIASSLDIYNMARFDFRVKGESEVWFLECNYIPGLAKDGSFHKMLHHHGMTVIDLISWIVANSIPFIRPAHYVEYERWKVPGCTDAVEELAD